MAKFDLHQLLNERSKAAAVEREKEPRTADGMEQLTLDVYDLIPSQENFYSTQYINDLKQSIAIVGLLQPLLVERDGDKFRVVAGHRRRLACMALVEDGLEQFRRVPDKLEEVGVLSINDAKALKQAEEARKPLEGQMELDAAAEGTDQTAQEAARNAPEAAGGTDTTTAAEGAQDAPETAQDGQQEGQTDKPPQKEPEKPAFVEREPRGRGCAWCNPDYHREQATAEGRFLLAYEPEEKLAMILDKETGAVEHMIFHCCPFCGRKLK